MGLVVLFNPEKDALNIKKHGISLAKTIDFDFLSSLTDIDDSQDYGETRYIAIGFLDAQLHVLVFTEERNGALRAISLRKAEPSERKLYEQS